MNHAFVDALLDGIDAKADLHRAAADMADLLDDEVLAVVAEAARYGSTPESVAAEVKRQHLSRKLLLFVASIARDADELTDRVRAAHAAAGITRAPRIPPVRREHLEERRARRTAHADSWIKSDFSLRVDARPRMPDLDDIVEMTDREILALLKRQGVAVDLEALLGEKMARATERIVGRRIPDESLIEQVAKSARSRLRQALMVEAKAVVRGMELAKHGVGADAPMIWISVLDDRTCDSCEDRHGESHILAEWEELGLPGDDVLLCDGNCRCEILPDERFEVPSDEEPEGDIQVSIELETTRD